MILDRSIQLGHYRSMIRLNIHEAKTHLSRYLEQIEAGEVVLLCRRNVPIAEIRAIRPATTEPRPLGLCKEGVMLKDSFFDPLPDELLDASRGGPREASARYVHVHLGREPTVEALGPGAGSVLRSGPRGLPQFGLGVGDRGEVPSRRTRLARTRGAVRSPSTGSPSHRGVTSDGGRDAASGSSTGHSPRPVRSHARLSGLARRDDDRHARRAYLRIPGADALVVDFASVTLCERTKPAPVQDEESGLRVVNGITPRSMSGDGLLRRWIVAEVKE